MRVSHLSTVLIGHLLFFVFVFVFVYLHISPIQIPMCLLSPPSDLPASLASFRANGTPCFAHCTMYIATQTCRQVQITEIHNTNISAKKTVQTLRAVQQHTTEEANIICAVQQKALYCSAAVGIHEAMKCRGEEIVLGKNTGKLPQLSGKVTQRATQGDTGP